MGRANALQLNSELEARGVLPTLESTAATGGEVAVGTEEVAETATKADTAAATPAAAGNKKGNKKNKKKKGRK